VEVISFLWFFSGLAVLGSCNSRGCRFIRDESFFSSLFNALMWLGFVFG
jgi:hypothetical protein